jgi:hypothetical protein
MPSKESKVTLKIPRGLYLRLKEIIDGSGFDSVTDFVVYILRDIASNVRPDQLSENEGKNASQLTADEVEKVRQRLKRLGYL